MIIWDYVQKELTPEEREQHRDLIHYHLVQEINLSYKTKPVYEIPPMDETDVRLLVMIQNVKAMETLADDITMKLPDPLREKLLQ